MLEIVLDGRAQYDTREETEEYIASSIERIIADRVASLARVMHPVCDSSPVAMPKPAGAERPATLIAQVAQAVETGMSGATDQNQARICSQRSQRPRNETPSPKNSQRCKSGFDWSAPWALLRVPSPEEVAERMRFYRLYGAGGVLTMLKGSLEYKLLK